MLFELAVLVTDVFGCVILRESAAAGELVHFICSGLVTTMCLAVQPLTVSQELG
jgi:hypothetical protein